MTKFIAQPPVERSRKVLAILAGVAAASEGSAYAVDLAYLSPEFTTNNVVGWVQNDLKRIDFDIQVTDSRSFKIKASDNSDKGLYFFPGLLNFSTFRMATSTGRGLSYGVQLFNAGLFFSTAKAGATYSGTVGWVSQSQALGQIDPEAPAYLLFEFEDNGVTYQGWIDVGIKVTGTTDGTFDNYLRINRYAWQASTLGPLAAGATPVPEPSTLVTSGLAALAGGAVALRRWRKERKATPKDAA